MRADFRQFRLDLPTAVGTAWQQIWEQDKNIDRTYIADFDVYGANAQNGAESVVDIYVGVRSLILI